jgi:hypothetical protein
LAQVLVVLLSVPALGPLVVMRWVTPSVLHMSHTNVGTHAGLQRQHNNRGP